MPNEITEQNPESQDAQQQQQGSDANGNGSGSGGGFSQERVNELVGQARQAGRESGVNSLLEDLGLGSTDELQEIITAVRDQREAEMSEVERLQARVQELEGVSSTAASLQERNEALEGVISERVTALYDDLNVPEHIQTLLEDRPADQRLSYLTENRSKFGTRSTPPTNTNAGNSGGSKKPKNIHENKQRSEELRGKYSI